MLRQSITKGTVMAQFEWAQLLGGGAIGSIAAAVATYVTGRRSHQAAADAAQITDRAQFTRDVMEELHATQAKQRLLKERLDATVSAMRHQQALFVGLVATLSGEMRS